MNRKNIRKKLAMMVTVLGLLIGVLSMPIQADAKQRYFLSGVSEAADGNMKMYYKGNTISFQGKMRKATSPKKVYDADEKNISCSLKVAPNCKVVLVEAENIQTTPYKKWAKENSYKKGDVVQCIQATVKVQGKKIVKISFSA